MTNVKKNKAENCMHSHNTYEAALSFVQKHLPGRYVAKAQEKLEKQGATFSKGFIRNVKSGDCINEQILAVLADIAQENKKHQDKLSQLVNS